MLNTQEATRDVYRRIAEGVGVFKEYELRTMEEVFRNYQQNPDSDYFLFEDKNAGTISGFIIFGKTPLTVFSWDIYWLVVDKQFQGIGIGRNLLKRVEGFVLQQDLKAVLRVETSTKKEFAHARNLYIRQGFIEAGRIPDFYGAEDDLIIYYKQIGEFFHNTRCG